MYLPRVCDPDQRPRSGAEYQTSAFGLGCVGCGGKCEGLGLFDSGVDFTGWGPMEFAAVGLGAFALFSMFSTSKRGYVAAREGVRRTRRRIGKRVSGK